MSAIYLEPAMVPAVMRIGYLGKQFKAVVCTEATIPMDAGLWSGGSRDKYYAIKLDTGENVALPGQQSAPWDKSRREQRVAIVPGFALVLHSMFCGKDMGLTFYLHPDNAAMLLPAPVTLTVHEKIVLNATASYKSSYMGRDRYDMARGDIRGQFEENTFPSRVEWDAAKQALIARGLLNKAGAITVAGRNAIPSKY